MQIEVVLEDMGPFSGKYQVRSLDTMEMAKIQDRVARKYRKLSDEALRTMVARELFACRVVGWKLESEVPYSREKVLWIFDHRPDVVSAILDIADEMIAKELEKDFLT